MAVEIKEKLGISLDFINLSGGIGVNYRPDQEPNDIALIGEGVRQVYEEVLTPAGLGQVKIFTELGRFMLAPHGILVTKVTHKRKPTVHIWGRCVSCQPYETGYVWSLSPYHQYDES